MPPPKVSTLPYAGGGPNATPLPGATPGQQPPASNVGTTPGSRGQIQQQSDAISQFVDGLAKATGLNKDVVAAWVLAEGAFTSGGTGHFNYLNVRPNGASSYSGVPLAGVSSGNFQEFNNVNDAITETAHWINTFGNYAGIRASTHLGPVAQLQAITASPWDQGNYAGGKLFADYATVTHKGSSWLSGVVGTVTSTASGLGKGALAAASGNPVGGAVDVLGAFGLDPNHVPVVGGLISAAEAPGKIAESVVSLVTWVFDPHNWLRVGYILGGSILVGGGLFLMAKSVGMSAALPAGVGGGGSSSSSGSSSGPDLGAEFDKGFAQGEAQQARAAGRSEARRSSATVTGSETARSVRVRENREAADAIGGDIPF